MKIFIINHIGENEINKVSILENLLEKFNLELKITEVGCIKGFFGEINDDNFLKILPLLNGYFGKYYFYENAKNNIQEELIFGKNIYDFEYDEKLIQESSLKIEKIKKDFGGNSLITNSKKEDAKKIINDSIYNIGGFLVKTFFLLEETLENKNDLQKLINDKNTFEEYKAQATLLNQVAFQKFELIKVRFDTINLELDMYASILNKYFKNFIK